MMLTGAVPPDCSINAASSCRSEMFSVVSDEFSVVRLSTDSCRSASSFLRLSLLSRADFRFAMTLRSLRSSRRFSGSSSMSSSSLSLPPSPASGPSPSSDLPISLMLRLLPVLEREASGYSSPVLEPSDTISPRSTSLMVTDSVLPLLIVSVGCLCWLLPCAVCRCAFRLDLLPKLRCVLVCSTRTTTAAVGCWLLLISHFVSGISDVLSDRSL
mmetsp:Transcript_22127/g.61558  ORF Transcript_22127/g.61558 Transcript_22127/m.61558 type:complete len:214 (+) Transcript_22127:321-962(+)